MSRVVIALGGNALGNSPAEQRRRIEAAAPALVDLVKQGHEILLSHGNGPQVGMLKEALDAAAAAHFPLPECTALSQGYIGYHLQRGIRSQLRREGLPGHAATVVTQIQVDPADPAFGKPTKPIGAFYSEAEARELMAQQPGTIYREDAGRGWRQVVASPKPLDIIEKESILHLLESDFVVIACGGGGIPVVKKGDGDFEGVPAVIDKDAASALLAELVDADALIILTAVDRVCVDYGKPSQRELSELTVDQAAALAAEGQFAPGSMLPKVEAAMRFAGSAPGRKAVIASLEKAPLAMAGRSGTVIRQ